MGFTADSDHPTLRPDSNPPFTREPDGGGGAGVPVVDVVVLPEVVDEVEPEDEVVVEGDGGGAEVKSEYNSWLGDPLGFFTTFEVAACINADLTVAGLAEGLLFKYKATTPAVWGVAMDVPEMVLLALSEVCHAEVI